RFARSVRTLGLIAILTCAPRNSEAQRPCTNPSPAVFSCTAGLPATAAFDYTPVVEPGDVFKLYVNGAQVGPDLPAQTAANIQVSFGATLPVGSYQIAVAIVRPAATPPESLSPPITLLLTPPAPTVPPSNLRIVEVIMRGLDVAGNELWRT